MGANLIRVPEVANKFLVAGVALPGIAKVTGCEAFAKLDVPDGAGTSGATVNYKGQKPKTFTVELHLLEEEDYDEWLDGQGRQILLTPPTGKKAQAFDVFHPSCDEVGITSALRESVGAADPVGDGSYKVKIVLMPSAPPKPSSSTPKGSAGGGGWEKAKPADAADAEIDNLINQAKQV